MLLSNVDILAAYDQGAIFFKDPTLNQPAKEGGDNLYPPLSFLKDPSLDEAKQRKRLEELLQVNSVDVTLGENVAWWTQNQGFFYPFGPTSKNEHLFFEGSFYLAHTQEFIGTTDKAFVDSKGNVHWLVAHFETRSTMARNGCPFHLSAGFGDAGFHGRWALEIAPARQVKIPIGERIGQVSFQALSSKPSRFYQSEYSQVDDWSFERCVLPRVQY